MMNEDEFGTFILTADSNATKYTGDGQKNCTVWYPGTIVQNMSDDQEEDYIQRMYLDRFTKIDPDPIIGDLMNKLDAAFIPFDYITDYEQDTGYIHHSFTCYVGNTNESEE